ncbi:glycosyltransferase family 2 protein [Nocardioides sp.]|uniref:glycosyltransferase family 2 protein n=1 Tax=Nocardioides sp. TaxID=35761 RepID=UPI002C431ABD|nr:glycosyltransferase family 2 protein [Nocardioides sp.]HXH78010.1 glycosyltransferase family 2 protein [Nocardioides sp.]
MDEHTLSIVIPVFNGEECLPSLIEAIAPLTEGFSTPEGRQARVAEVVLVHDCGVDNSDDLIRRLAAAHDWIRPIWLSRNFGQHAATLAGMSSSGGDWVATLDEDGQHDPRALGGMLDTAMGERADVVYAAPVNRRPHGLVRNAASWLAKRSLRLMTGNADALRYNSYRLMLGDVARSVAAYAGPGVYLDVALGWVARTVTTSPVTLATEGRPSGYRIPSLLSHYRRMVLTGGTRLLRVVSGIGLLFAALGFALALVVVGIRIFGDIPVAGWASVMVVSLISSGVTLTALGIVAEYVGVAVNMALGKPLFLMVRDRADGPLGREGAERSSL